MKVIKNKKINLYFRAGKSANKRLRSVRDADIYAVIKKPGKSKRPVKQIKPPSPVSSDEPAPTLPPHQVELQETDEQVCTSETIIVQVWLQCLSE